MGANNHKMWRNSVMVGLKKKKKLKHEEIEQGQLDL
jgi:hypothetical protein